MLVSRWGRRERVINRDLLHLKIHFFMTIIAYICDSLVSNRSFLKCESPFQIHICRLYQSTNQLGDGVWEAEFRSYETWNDKISTFRVLLILSHPHVPSSPTPTRPVLMVKVRERENDKNGISPTGYHSNLRSPNGSPTHNRCHLYYKIREEYRDIQTKKKRIAQNRQSARAQVVLCGICRLWRPLRCRASGQAIETIRMMKLFLSCFD